jgi:hypothetical protein
MLFVSLGSRTLARLVAKRCWAEAADGVSQASSELVVDQCTSTSAAIAP